MGRFSPKPDIGPISVSFGKLLGSITRKRYDVENRNTRKLWKSASGMVDARWQGGSGQEAYPSPVMGVRGYYPCNLVHFWRPVQQKMYNSVFNLDFGRSIWWHQVIRSGTENRRFLPSLLYIGSTTPGLVVTRCSWKLDRGALGLILSHLLTALTECDNLFVKWNIAYKL